MTKLIKDFHKLWERLIELSNKAIPDVSYKIYYNKINKILCTYNFTTGRYEYYSKSIIAKSSSFTFK